MSYLLHIATTNPSFYHDQKNFVDFYVNTTDEDDTLSKRKIKAVASRSGIKKRFSVIPDFSLDANEFQFFNQHKSLLPEIGLNKRMELFKNEALKLSVNAVKNIPNFEELKTGITHIISVTCTGLYAPGLDIELMQALELHPTTQRSSINFMGCNAAILALKQAHEICENSDNATVLIVCTELCTIHFQRQFTDDYIVSNCLFADGSAAALVSSKCKTISPLSKPLKIESFNSLVAHEGSSDMAWQVTETGFMMKLTPYVSGIINKHLPDLLAPINDASINKFVIHPGGKKILDECLKTLSLTKTDLQESYETLEQFGNMSSPTILFALKNYIENHSSNMHQTICALGFGPGLSIESVRFTHV